MGHLWILAFILGAIYMVDGNILDTLPDLTFTFNGKQFSMSVNVSMVQSYVKLSHSFFSLIVMRVGTKYFLYCLREKRHFLLILAPHSYPRSLQFTEQRY